jgi:hypothetical protein
VNIDKIPDSDLLRRAVVNCRDGRQRKGIAHPRWTAVMHVFALGATYACQLCRRFDLDPDEMVRR